MISIVNCLLKVITKNVYNNIARSAYDASIVYLIARNSKELIRQIPTCPDIKRSDLSS
jgi:uncharacterized FlaG/YvyC family protein